VIDEKEALEKASHILCACEALAILRLGHMGHHFLKPCGFYFHLYVKVRGCKTFKQRVAQNIGNG
jgi:hypothetical protein